MNWFSRKPQNRMHRHDLRGLESKLRTRIRSQRQTRVAALALAGALLAGLLGWGAWLGMKEGAREVFTENPAYAVREITVESSGDALKPNQVLSFLRVQRGQNLLGLDLEQMRRDLEVLPMVERAEVTRELPSRLMVHITERIAVANVSSVASDKRFQVDRHGVVMDLLAYVKNSEEYRRRLEILPEIIGANMTDLKVGRVTTSAEIVKAIVLIEKMMRLDFGSPVEIESVDVSRHGMLVLNTADHAVIKIGVSDAFPDMEQQLRRLAKIMADSHLDPEQRSKRLASVDLTVRNDIPVVWVSNP